MRPMEACARQWARTRGVEIGFARRSLTEFGDQPLEDVAGAYDLIVIDHPFCGTARELGCLRPLDELVDSATIQGLEADAVGPSHLSYTYGGHQWGLATDAACQLSALRPDLLDDHPVPATWEEVLRLARERPGRVALPLSAPHAICSVLTLCANAGVPVCSEPDRFMDESVGVAAIELLQELARLGPRDALAWEPPDALRVLTSTDELVYVPLVFGFVTYSSASKAERPCRFAGIPSAGRGPVGSILGGAGLAVSATSRHPAEAAAFAVWASSAAVQRGIVAPAGGQPGSRGAWEDDRLNDSAGGFFSAARATIDAAWVRPRDHRWPGFQLEAGNLLNEGLREGVRPRAIVAALEQRYQRVYRAAHEDR